MKTDLPTILTPEDFELIFSLPRGRAKRMADAGMVPHLRLPNGEVRFETAQLFETLRVRPVPQGVQDGR